MKHEENLETYRKLQEDPLNDGLLTSGINKFSTTHIFIEEKSKHLQVIETRFYEILVKRSYTTY